ncbi:alpha/beta hydrolase [Cellulomonas sp. zg-ZUI222]|uniref:Alpha/beta hydrolase n=1 Tax=Cellulomonas wangleii TaxID=2816956 RepID=A0ABX8D7H4_9CELL|nr:MULTISPECIES: alpha/beta hydrolase [Cellulomonas]MBO0901488.1 alpha/beta hydrolase [Cellulomonas sp. zg-ZUI22]MBO0922393.1 alpha/beta hydrolase [Cellulomonas wangleii]MBO0926088.1 alpha/beta hydrolase [Cellulomonas wangleii]QVI63374.1 alpha/beta hydrolase [Cellulomonas wangleii]
MTASPIVLLHAFPLDHRMWDDVAGALARTRPVLAPDLPVPVGSDLPEPSLEAAADHVAQVVRDAGTGPVVVAGLSMGGYVALALLERHPELVAGLALVDTKSTADTPEAAAKREGVAAEVEAAGSVDPVRGMVGTLLGETTRGARPEVVERVTAWIGEQDPARVTWAQRAMAARPDRTETLRLFTGPVTVVVGDEDAVTGTDAADHMVATAADGLLVVVPRVGHLSAVEDPAAVATALSELANRVDAG